MSTPFEFFRYRGEQLCAAGVPLEKIASKTGTPVYVYSADAMLQSLNELQAGLAGMDHSICYAVKANSNLAILRMLVKAGAGLDIVSGGELFRARMAKAPADRIVFSGVGKTPGEMAEALSIGKSGIFAFNVESLPELSVLSAVSQHVQRIARVSLRLNPDVDAKTHPYVSTGLRKNKFGIERAEALEAARNIESLPGIEMVGLSIHIGSQLLDLGPLADAFEKIAALVEELDAILPAPLSHVDLGGGVGISYDGGKSPSIRDYCALIRKWFGPRSRIQKKREIPLKILIEPGRMLAGNAGALVTEVLYEKRRRNKNFIVVDAAMNDLIRPALYESHHEIMPTRKPLDRGFAKADIVGPVCETGDFFARDRSVSESIAPGDLLAILSSGAYGFTMASNYNSRPRPPEVLVTGNRFRVIRERETYADLIKGESV